MQPPIPYSPDVETIAEDEAETLQQLEEALRQILETTAEDYGHALRSVHAKSHAVIEGELAVLPDLPPELAQGLFALPARHPVLLRISTNPGDILDDSVTVPRGIALKVLEVEGPRLQNDGAATQDFLLVDGPAFLNRDARGFLGGLQLLARTTDRAEWAKKAMSAVLRGTERALEAVGSQSAMIKSMGGAPPLHPLGETYYSQVPFRYGEHVAKFSLVPVSPSLTCFAGQEVSVHGRPDALRAEMDKALRGGPFEWEFRVQLCRDLEEMPVEDASAVWSEEASPWLPVARLTAGAQMGRGEVRRAAVDDHMRFWPWTGLAAHRPLGSVNRARRETYRMSSEFRARVNRCPIHEPAALDLPR